jgi:hypothetical protein
MDMEENVDLKMTIYLNIFLHVCLLVCGKEKHGWCVLEREENGLSLETTKLKEI